MDAVKLPESIRSKNRLSTSRGSKEKSPAAFSRQNSTGEVSAGRCPYLTRVGTMLRSMTVRSSKVS